jgi:hypothetical protein
VEDEPQKVDNGDMTHSVKRKRLIKIGHTGPDHSPFEMSKQKSLTKHKDIDLDDFLDIPGCPGRLDPVSGERQQVHQDEEQMVGLPEPRV